MSRESGKVMYIFTICILVYFDCYMLANAYAAWAAVIATLSLDETDFEERMGEAWQTANRDIFQLQYATWKIPRWVQLYDIQIQDLIDVPFLDHADLPSNYAFLTDYKSNLYSKMAKLNEGSQTTPKEKNLYISTDMFKKYKLSVSKDYKEQYNQLFLESWFNAGAKLRQWWLVRAKTLVRVQNTFIALNLVERGVYSKDLYEYAAYWTDGPWTIEALEFGLLMKGADNLYASKLLNLKQWKQAAAFLTVEASILQSRLHVKEIIINEITRDLYDINPIADEAYHINNVERNLYRVIEPANEKGKRKSKKNINYKRKKKIIHENDIQ